MVKKRHKSRMLNQPFGRWPYFLITILWFSLASIQAQSDTSYTLIRSIPCAAKFFTTDKLQQTYLINAKNEVVKYNTSGTPIFRYNNNTLGRLHVVDATNPFNVLLYYPDYQTVITLDRTLNKTGEINLFDLDIINVQAIASSNDNNVWVYDDVSFKLKKINQNGQVLAESNDLSLLLGSAPQPAQIKARENWVYVNDPDMGILIFDAFAQYHKTLPFKNANYFQLIGDQLLYEQEGKLLNFNLKSLLTNPILLPTALKAADQFSFQKNHFYVLKEKQLDVYSFK